jgi:NTE family protein
MVDHRSNQHLLHEHDASIGSTAPTPPNVELDGRVLIDGGTVNPVPYDVLADSCDLVIAIDINSGSVAERGTVPGYFDNVFGSIQIMQQAIVKQELQASPPDIYIKPELGDFRTLHFHKADEIYRQAQPAKEELKRRLEEMLVG